MVAKNLIA